MSAQSVKSASPLSSPRQVSAMPELDLDVAWQRLGQARAFYSTPPGLRVMVLGRKLGMQLGEFFALLVTLRL